MQGIMEQLVEDISNMPSKLKWKDARTDPPDTTKTLLILDFNTDIDEDLPQTDDDLRSMCAFRIAEFSNFYQSWYNINNEEDVRFDWYIEINTLPPKYEFCDGLAMIPVEFQSWLDKRNAVIPR